MTNFKGTKGKWKIDLEKSKSIISLNNGQIDVWHWRDVESGEYNALLISKAPEMLAMLEYLVENHYIANLDNVKKVKQLIIESTEL